MDEIDSRGRKGEEVPSPVALAIERIRNELSKTIPDKGDTSS
jgi:hypothetical protein